MPVLIVPVLIMLDQIFKLWAARALDPVPDPFLPGLYLTYVKNTGAAFGLFQGQTEALGWLSLAVGVALLVYLAARCRRPANPWGELAVALIAAGALGNSIDRIGRGYVIDYLDIGPGLWPVFNLADASVVVGVALVFLLGLFGRKK